MIATVALIGFGLVAYRLGGSELLALYSLLYVPMYVVAAVRLWMNRA